MCIENCGSFELFCSEVRAVAGSSSDPSIYASSGSGSHSSREKSQGRKLVFSSAVMARSLGLIAAGQAAAESVGNQRNEVLLSNGMGSGTVIGMDRGRDGSDLSTIHHSGPFEDLLVDYDADDFWGPLFDSLDSRAAEALATETSKDIALVKKGLRLNRLAVESMGQFVAADGSHHGSRIAAETYDEAQADTSDLGRSAR